ncbi:MAG: hypothetical protein QF384_14590 [Alphaproteobacteria bacterium]|nr:hypothetical protein [Alphaproteobacteria bacterium]
MTGIYVHARILAAPRRWQVVSDALCTGGAERLRAADGALYGVWRSQIGRPRDELTVLMLWPDGGDSAKAMELLLDGVADVADFESQAMAPTLRPEHSDPPRRQGNYAFRWFDLPMENWPEFLELCTAAWPGFESSYDSQVIGLWQCLDSTEGRRRSLLLTRRPDLAMWERSKIPQGEEEAEVRRQLSRRYDLCDDTYVYTTTLLSAEDREDTVRWT